MPKKYRQSTNIEDRRNASFFDRTDNARTERLKRGNPDPKTYKEPLEWQRDDATDSLNFKTNQARPNNKVKGRGFITDTLAMAKNRKLGTTPQKKLIQSKNTLDTNVPHSYQFFKVKKVKQ